MKKRMLSGFMMLLLCICMVTPLNIYAAEDDNPIPKAKQSVVNVVSGIDYENGELYSLNADGSYSTGTGFGVGDADEDADTFLTNCHVVSDVNGLPYKYVYIRIDGADMFDESTMIKAEVIYADSEVDLAVIQTEDSIQGVTTLPLLAAEMMETGESVYALGFPGIADEIADSNEFTVDDITVTNGVLSRYLTSGGIELVAHTAETNRGNSGGPLINNEGEVIGINTLILADSQTADLRCYAIYIDYAMEALEDLDIEYTDASEESNGSSVRGDLFESNMMILIMAAIVIIVLVVVIIVLAVGRRGRNEAVQSRSEMVQPRPEIMYSRPEVVQSIPTHVVRAISGPLTGNTWQLNHVLTIGRDPSGNIVYPANTKGISRVHCRLELRAGVVTVTDMGSTYGTFVNGRKLNPNESIRISSNTVISLGGEQVKLMLS